jgi:hypothetical protein
MEVGWAGTGVGLPWVAIGWLVAGTLQPTRASIMLMTNKDERRVFILQSSTVIFIKMVILSFLREKQ